MVGHVTNASHSSGRMAQWPTRRSTRTRALLEAEPSAEQRGNRLPAAKSQEGTPVKEHPRHLLAAPAPPEAIGELAEGDHIFTADHARTANANLLGTDASPHFLLGYGHGRKLKGEKDRKRSTWASKDQNMHFAPGPTVLR